MNGARADHFGGITEMVEHNVVWAHGKTPHIRRSDHIGDVTDMIRINKDRVQITLNGTFVNGRQIRERHPLREGDQIHVGDFMMAFKTRYSPAI